LRNKSSRLRSKIKLLTAISILSSILATLTLILCVILIYFLFIKKDQVDTSSDINSEMALQENINEDSTDEKLSELDSTTNMSIDTSPVNTADTSLNQISADINNIDNTSGSKIISDIKSALAQGDSAIAIFRRLFPDDVVITSGNTYSLIPVDKSLKLNEKDGDIDFDDPDLLKGIDVSTYQGEIDWEKVAACNIDFAIIRAGIRGYTEGGLLCDDSFVTNASSANDNNIPIGVYFFTQAISNDEAIEEAEFVIDSIKDYKIDWPIYLDVEDIGKSNGRTNSLTKEERTEFALTFINEIQKAGYKAGLYGNLKTYITMLDMSKFQDTDIWLAAYTQPIYFPYHYDTLQYSEKGTIEGIPQPVDINVSWKNY